jgi:hypothetical protein
MGQFEEKEFDRDGPRLSGYKAEEVLYLYPGNLCPSLLILSVDSSHL